MDIERRKADACRCVLTSEVDRLMRRRTCRRSSLAYRPLWTSGIRAETDETFQCAASMADGKQQSLIDGSFTLATTAIGSCPRRTAVARPACVGRWRRQGFGHTGVQSGAARRVP